MKNIFIFSIIFISMAVMSASAQVYTIRGIVRDSSTQKPLINASININYGQKGLISDEKGSFKINAPAGEVFLNTRFLNFYPSRIRLNLRSDTLIIIDLIEFSNNLEQITISTKSSDNNVKRPLMGVNSLNLVTLKRIPTLLGEVDVFRSLQMLPGVSSVGEASNGVNIRGGTTDQNLILLDEAPMFNATHMFGLFSAFPSEAISKFDLYKGNVPANYGGRAAAVLDVSLANPSLTKTKFQAGVGLVSSKLFLETPIIKDKLGILITGRVSANDFLLPIVSSKLDDIKAKFADAAIKIFYKINPKNTLSFTAYNSYDFIQTNILGSINNINSTATQYDYRTLNFSGKWFKSINNHLSLQTIVVSSQYVPQVLLPEFDSDNKVSIYQDIDFKQVKTNLNYNKGNLNIKAGLDASRYIINPGEIRPGSSISVASIVTPQENGLEIGAFIENEFKIGEVISILAGLRYSDYRTFGPSTILKYKSNEEKLSENVIDSVKYASTDVIQNYGGFEPRLGLNLALNKNSSIKAGFNIMRQYLQVISNTTTPIPTSRWKSSDQNIKPQISQLGSIGYFRNLSNNVFEISSEIYYKTTQNMVDYKPGASFLLQKNIETELLQGINKSYGLELMASKNKGELTGWLNYTYARSFNKVKEGDTFTQQINNGNWYAANYDRPHTVNASVVISQTKIHDFSFNFTYATGRPFTAPKAFIRSNGVLYPLYTDRNNDRIPDYHRLDFSWNIYNPAQKVKKFKGNWNFTIYNLYGRKNAYSVFFRNNGIVPKSYKLTVFGAPILSLSYNIKIE